MGHEFFHSIIIKSHPITVNDTYSRLSSQLNWIGGSMSMLFHRYNTNTISHLVTELKTLSTWPKSFLNSHFFVKTSMNMADGTRSDSLIALRQNIIKYKLTIRFIWRNTNNNIIIVIYTTVMGSFQSGQTKVLIRRALFGTSFLALCQFMDEQRFPINVGSVTQGTVKVLDRQ